MGVERLAYDVDGVDFFLLCRGNGVLNGLGVAADRHGVFRSDGLHFFFANQMGNVERFQHRLQLHGSLFRREILEFHRIVKTAAGAFLDMLHGI